MRRNSAPHGNPGGYDQWGTQGERPTSDDGIPDGLAYDTVIVPARLDAEVAQRVAMASDRDGVSIADLLGRAAAAYDWGDDSDRPRRGRS